MAIFIIRRTKGTLMNRKEKIQHLNEFLKARHRLSLAEAIEMKDEAFAGILEGSEIPSAEILKKIADFFFLNVNLLTDDGKELPHDDALYVDETVVALRRNEYEQQLSKKKHSHVIKRNYALLDKKGKRKLWLNLALTSIPFLAFIVYSYATVSVNRAETLENYRAGNELSEEQQAIRDSLPQNGANSVTHYAEINIGTQLESISNISTSDSNYTVTMSLRYDFDQMDYHKMWWEKEKGIPFNKDGFYSEEDLSQDAWSLNSEGDGWLPYPDNVPDVIQFNFEDASGNPLHLSSSLEPTSISTLYIAERAAYPGEKSSNVYADKNDEFSIGNGHISADSLEYQDRGTAYYDKSAKTYRFSQKLHFSAQITKKFDSPRYPLDSAQFHIYIQPTRNTNYIRYIPDLSMSGLSPYFDISGGYQLIKEKDGITSFAILTNYYTDTDLDRSSSTFGQKIVKTQLEVIVRANKHGISVFLNSFLNIIAVACWLTLAFFNQSFNKDDSISMIGTGFFSAISAILLGLSLTSSGNVFSLLTMVNIFTLGMVLVMGYESIAAKRAIKTSNAAQVAYRTVKLRILFYFFVIASLAVYFGLPALAYLWAI